MRPYLFVSPASFPPLLNHIDFDLRRSSLKVPCHRIVQRGIELGLALHHRHTA